MHADLRGIGVIDRVPKRRKPLSQLRSHEWSSGAFHTEELELLPSEMDVAPEFDGNDELDDDTFY